MSRRGGEMAAGQDKVLTRLSVGNVSQLQPAQGGGGWGWGWGQGFSKPRGTVGRLNSRIRQRIHRQESVSQGSHHGRAENVSAESFRTLLKRPQAPGCTHSLQRIRTTSNNLRLSLFHTLLWTHTHKSECDF